VATFVFVFLLATQVPFAYAGSTTHTVTANGNAQISTAQSKFGGASGLFDGTGDGLSVPDSADWYFGTGEFTIDCWVRFNALPASGAYVTFLRQGSDDTHLWIYHVYNNLGTYQIQFAVLNGGVIINTIQNSPGLSTNTWYHMAVVRNGNNFMLFQDGTQIGSTVTDSDEIQDIGAVLTIADHPTAPEDLNGWLDEVRISKGVARWTSGFTPPVAAYTTDSNAVLLLHMDGTDGSTTFTDSSAVTEPDFSIGSSPTSQSISAGNTASYTLSLTSLNTYSGTVSLSVTSGLPSGATGTVTPNSVSLASGETKTATLSVSTSITTPGATSSIVVTSTDGTKTHTVTVSLTVVPPWSGTFNVKAGATQIVVTLTYSWSGSGSPPSGSITIAGPGGTPTLSESGAVVYDRTSITVSGSTNTYSIMHRATFTITAPGSAQTWTAYVSLAGVSNYNVAIEVS
jgi:hypothetical protein